MRQTADQPLQREESGMFRFNRLAARPRPQVGKAQACLKQKRVEKVLSTRCRMCVLYSCTNAPSSSRASKPSVASSKMASRSERVSSSRLRLVRMSSVST